ncbi:MAG: hypothetical protein ACYS1A_11810 [Planctomycetota bacterium]|jgi:hypothetical protein
MKIALFYMVIGICFIAPVLYAEQVPILEVDQNADSGHTHGRLFYLGSTMLAQSFVPDYNNVGAVQSPIEVQRNGADPWDVVPPNYTIEIRPDSGGFPSDVVLGSSTQLYESIEDQILFDPPIQVTPGQTYYIVAYITPGEDDDVSVKHAAEDNFYPYGQAYHTDENGDWVVGSIRLSYPNRDYTFRTFATTGYHQRPVADAGEDQFAYVNELVVLDATDSYDDGEITKYVWQRRPADMWAGQEYSKRYDSFNPTIEIRASGYAEELYELTVYDDMGVVSATTDTIKIINPGVEGPEGPQGPPGITPTEIAQLQEQIGALQAQIAALQQIVEENRLAMEQFMPLKKLLEELGS